MKWNEEGSSQLWTQLMQLRKEGEKMSSYTPARYEFMKGFCLSGKASLVSITCYTNCFTKLRIITLLKLGIIWTIESFSNCSVSFSSKIRKVAIYVLIRHLLKISQPSRTVNFNWLVGKINHPLTVIVPSFATLTSSEAPITEWLRGTSDLDAIISFIPATLATGHWIDFATYTKILDWGGMTKVLRQVPRKLKLETFALFNTTKR